MFKSRIPLQTPLVAKLVLFSILVTFFAGWSSSSEASTQDLAQQTTILTMKSKSSKQDTADKLTQMARLAHEQVNQYRASLNLSPLKFNASIAEESRIHSENMAQQKVKFSHDGFQDRVDAIAKSIPYRSVAENVAYNMGYQDPVSIAVDGWIKSDGHRQNMEGNYNLTGIGVAMNPQGEYYFTQIFILKN